MQFFFLKIPNEMANIVDPEEQSDLGLYHLHMPFVKYAYVKNVVYEILGHLSQLLTLN